MDRLFFHAKKFVPKSLYDIIAPPYHFLLAFFAAVFYRFPSKKLFVIGVTGTKGKTTVTELLNAMLEEGGYTTALSNSTRFKIASESRDNFKKMTMPGRFFVQKFLRNAVEKNCTHAVVEMTSEGARQFRHRFIELNALIFTNLAPEHIESHGSYERYRDAKLSIAKALERSPKKNTYIVVNSDDAEAEKFLSVRVERKYRYALKDAEPYELKRNGLSLTWKGKKINSSLSGQFNISNILAAATCAEHIPIEEAAIRKTIETFKGVPGRMESIDLGQDFTIIVDYAHTPDSLEKVYEAFPLSQKICVLGAAGGGRDKWKRPVLGSIASKHCSRIILANEDPYDENPREIVDNIAEGINDAAYDVVLDRQEAIKEALRTAKTGDVVIITGKGSEPYMMGPNGEKIPWNEVKVVREELKKLLKIPNSLNF